MKAKRSTYGLILLGGLFLFALQGFYGKSYAENNTESGDTKAASWKFFKVGVARWVTNGEYDRKIQAFKEALSAAGLVEGKNIEYFVQNPELDIDRQRKIIQEFIDRKVDLIYSLTTPGTLEAKKMVQDIPIVFSIVTYPVEAGLIDGLSSSHNNLVGTRNWIHMSKLLELLMAVAPKVKIVGFVHRKGEPNSNIQYQDMIKESKRWGLKVVEVALEKVMETKAFCLKYVNRVDVFFMANDTLIQGGGEEAVIEVANSHGKPTLSGNKSGVLKGGLVGDVADFYNIGRLAGEKAVDILLYGKKPTDLVTETQRGSFVLVNLKTAKHLGIAIPDRILSIAQVVIVE